MKPQKSSCNVLIFGSILCTALFLITTLYNYDSLIHSLLSQHKKTTTDSSGFTFSVKDESTIKPFEHKNITRESLGHQTWTFLHLMSAYYPENPTHLEVAKMQLFFKTLAEFYPCKECGNHFMRLLLDNPVKASSRKEFMDYLCGLHNKVNERLGKPIFNCTEVVESWGPGGKLKPIEKKP